VTGLRFLELSLGDDAALIRAAIDRVLARGWFILGPELEAFEAEFAQAAGARFAVGVANGTDAITLLLRAARLSPGDEVIIPALTAAFTGLAVVAAGGVPVIVDVDARTLTLDVAACEAALTPRVKAIVPVHLYGQPAELDSLAAFAQRHQLALVEDCCQSHLATYKGNPVGTSGIGGAFSFYPTKNLAALGDAGAVITNDPLIAERVRLLRNGGQMPRNYHVDTGINSRLDELQAAVLRARLPQLPALTGRRREIGRSYRRLLASTIDIPAEREAGHVYHLFPVRSRRRDALQQYLQGAGIETLIHYPVALSDQKAFERFHPVHCPVATSAASEVLSLPLHPRLTDDDVRRVAEAVSTFQAQSA
jgi:dTDP-4-amino-4,6-dideoxygalactose transaminase